MDKTAPLRATITLGIPAIVLKVIASQSGSAAADIAGNALLFGIVGMLIVAAIYFSTRRIP